MERGNINVKPTNEADIYSMGMMLYEMFNDKLAFKDA